MNLQILPLAEKVEKRRGRPKKNELINHNVSFQIEAEIELNLDVQTEERKMFGRFVLASNKIDLDPEVMLNNYKGQQTVERGFRFLKDKSFHVSEVYLKMEERIESLCMVMVLSLLIYSFAEWRLREKLKETGKTVPNQLNKPTQRPTMRWVFEIFMGVIQSIATDGGKIIKIAVNLNGPQTTILRLLGRECQKLLQDGLKVRNVGSIIYLPSCGLCSLPQLGDCPFDCFRRCGSGFCGRIPSDYLLQALPLPLRHFAVIGL